MIVGGGSFFRMNWKVVPLVALGAEKHVAFWRALFVLLILLLLQMRAGMWSRDLIWRRRAWTSDSNAPIHEQIDIGLFFFDTSRSLWSSFRMTKKTDEP